jgi:hypothetical protein
MEFLQNLPGKEMSKDFLTCLIFADRLDRRHTVDLFSVAPGEIIKNTWICTFAYNSQWPSRLVQVLHPLIVHC